MASSHQSQPVEEIKSVPMITDSIPEDDSDSKIIRRNWDKAAQLFFVRSSKEKMLIPRYAGLSGRRLPVLSTRFSSNLFRLPSGLEIPVPIPVGLIAFIGIYGGTRAWRMLALLLLRLGGCSP